MNFARSIAPLMSTFVLLVALYPACTSASEDPIQAARQQVEDTWNEITRIESQLDEGEGTIVAYTGRIAFLQTRRANLAIEIAAAGFWTDITPLQKEIASIESQIAGLEFAIGRLEVVIIDLEVRQASLLVEYVRQRTAYYSLLGSQSSDNMMGD